MRKTLCIPFIFSVPNNLIEEYGEMTAVHATWLNARTSPIFVTGDETVYNAVRAYLGQYVDGGNYWLLSDENKNNGLAVFADCFKVH